MGAAGGGPVADRGTTGPPPPGPAVVGGSWLVVAKVAGRAPAGPVWTAVVAGAGPTGGF
ncbi:MAG: hypothetical protein ACRDZY_20655 [Acidimicrobiales bacterium]